MTKNSTTVIPLAVAPDDVARSSVTAVASPSVLGGLDPLLKDLRDYPYGCWEQRLSKGLGAALYLGLKEYTALEWTDARKQVEQLLTDASSFQAPNGGMCFYKAEDARVSPYLSVYTLFVFQQLKADGFEIPSAVETKLTAYLQSLLHTDVYPDWYSQESRSLFIALSMRTLAEAGGLTATDVSRWRDRVATMSAFAKAQYLYALQKVGAATDLRNEVEVALTNQIHDTSGTSRVRETEGAMSDWVLSSSMRSQCGVLEVFSSLYGSQSAWHERLAGLVRGAYLRDESPLFRTTQEQLFCLLGMRRYSQAVESGSGVVTFSIRQEGSDKEILQGSFSSPQDDAIEKTESFADLGNGSIAIRSDGERPVYSRLGVEIVKSSMSLPKRNRGIEVVREYSVLRDGKRSLLKDGDVVYRGELIRVDLFVGIPSDRYYVVIEDPVAGGIEPVNRDLKTASMPDADKEAHFSSNSYHRQYSNWVNYGEGFWSFYHRELGHDVVRFYSEFLSPGRYHLSYVGQIIAQGRFHVPPAYAEEMYMPEVHGNSMPRILDVQEQP